MTRPVRIQLSRRKGWHMPANAVSVARPTKWGNPFVIGRDGTRAQCIALYRRMVAGEPVDAGPGPAELARTRRFIAEHVHELRGKNLACWCPLPAPGKPDLCHAAVLLELAKTTG
jgi:hypothetical protein